MSIFTQFWPHIENALRIVPGLVLLPLTLFLGWKKIGHKVHVSYTTTYERLSASRLTDLVITNLKDKPIAVYEIHLLIDRHFVIPVQKFNPPVIIKGLESAVVETQPVSEYFLGEQVFELGTRGGQLFEIYLTTHAGLIKCKVVNPPSITAYQKFKDYEMAVAHTQKYNGIVYNDTAMYAVIYRFEGATHTAIVEQGGFIVTGWPFLPNELPQEAMLSAEMVRKALAASEIQHVINTKELYVHRLKNRPGR